MNKEKFLKVCLDSLDTDVTPNDEVSDTVDCAETISVLIKKVFPDFKIQIGTIGLEKQLYNDKRFERIATSERGCIIISPSIANSDGSIKTFGHTGMFITSERIASNDSNTGEFKGNYTWQTWIKRYKDNLGLRIFLYRIKN